MRKSNEATTLKEAFNENGKAWASLDILRGGDGGFTLNYTVT
jgi:hypothetical protein